MIIRYYGDFEIVITEQDGRLFADLAVAPGGRHLSQPIPITLPADHDDWTEACQGRRGEAELAKLGYRLFNAIIKGELAGHWHACLGDLDNHPEMGLRLRFSYQVGALDHVPLELLCGRTDPTYEFVALDPKTPVVRSPRYGGSVRKRNITLPLRMLAVIANPALQERIDPVAERTNLERALAGLVQSGNLIIDYLGLPGHPGADYQTLHHTLVGTRHPYDIVHFIGHGSMPDDEGAEGVLVLVDPATGRCHNVRASDLADLLADSGVRFVVLQACDGARAGTHDAFKGVAQRCIAKGLPAVLAMQCRVSRDMAILFCGEFYKFWRDGSLIEYAVTEARRAVRQHFDVGIPEWWAPVLFMRQGSAEVLKVRRSEQPFRGQPNTKERSTPGPLGQAQDPLEAGPPPAGNEVRSPKRKVQIWFKVIVGMVTLTASLIALLGDVLDVWQLWPGGPQATGTAISSPTASPGAPTLAPTATLVPVVVPVSPPPTFTPSPIPTPLPSPTPTFTPSPTNTPSPTPVPPSPTPPPSLPPSPAAARTFPRPAPTPLSLSKPEAGETVGAGHVTRVTFEWAGTLKPSQVFRVIVRHVEPEFSFESPDLSASTWTTELPSEYVGECRWQVVVQNQETVVARSEERHFWFKPCQDPMPTPSP